MLTKVQSCSIKGLKVDGVDVEVDISSGLPVTHIVGLPDLEIKESKERVRSALNNSGYKFPLGRIIINLAPADTKKTGTHFDLPIAIGILSTQNRVQPEHLHSTVLLGELSLDGKLQKIRGVLPMLLEMKSKGYTKAIIPESNLYEARHVNDMNCVGLESLKEVVDYLNGGLIVNQTKIFDAFSSDTKTGSLDFEDLRGQFNVKRGMEIAAAGGHNLLMIGPPGSGKTMAAKRLPSILPKLTFDEAIEITKIYSITGLLGDNSGLVTTRPFRSPHHTISNIALTGGGKNPKPGEVSLSHLGVLFLDELPEFSKSAIEVLRQPIEDGEISISRVNGSYTYPSKFMLVASMNPCPCGYSTAETSNECICSSREIHNYTRKISGPMLDRIDIVVETAPVEYQDLAGDEKTETSDSIKKRVEKARGIQNDRLSKQKITCNAQMTPSQVKKFCKLDKEGKELLELVFKKMKLSARGYNRVLKVARTIADLESSKEITTTHLAEALQYRKKEL
ncbi:MAG: YifB family Mg chelatase-like AAA ATPase [Alkaliphilus sp.]